MSNHSRGLRGTSLFGGRRGREGGSQTSPSEVKKRLRLTQWVSK